jgi:NAD(P)-dependent dehydrogenase (short-subunit alcohol dehydrogenase family)
MAGLAGKVAIITGAASGIGAASARIMAQQGASVVVADINGDGAETVAKDIRNAGFTAVAAQTDVASEDDIRAMVDLAVDQFGGLDILHNNAALMPPDVIARDVMIVDIDAELFARILRVNLIGYALGAKHAIPRMLARGGGVIINTGSVAADLAEFVRPMYGASKAGIDGLTRSIATQYGKQNIRAVTVLPGHILTPAAKAVIPPAVTDRLLRHGLMPRSGEPEDLGYLVAFLASDDAGFITGVSIPVDGGLSAHFPTYAEDYADFQK